MYIKFCIGGEMNRAVIRRAMKKVVSEMFYEHSCIGFTEPQKKEIKNALYDENILDVIFVYGDMFEDCVEELLIEVRKNQNIVDKQIKMMEKK